MSMTQFRVQDDTQTLANYLRSDKLFRAKNISDSKLRKMLIGLAFELARTEEKLQEISDEYDPQQTTRLLDEWESALGIPDDCIPKKDDPDLRRNNILLKLTALGVSTKEGFEALGATLGLDVTVYAGRDALTFPYSFPLLLLNLDVRWVMYVEGDESIADTVLPYTFPFTFGEDRTLILRCLFEKLVPSNVRVIFNFV